MTATTARQRIAALKSWKKPGRLSSSLANKLPHYDNDLEKQMRRSLLITRYLLFILTSAFYLAGPPHSHFYVKVVVVLTMLVATMLAQNLYDSWEPRGLFSQKDSETISVIERNNYSLLRLIMVETIGVALLILPTGGLDSPFAWYALNPIMAAALFLPGFNCWGVLAVFLTSAIAASKFYPGISVPFLSFVYDHLSKLLVFFLTTSMTQVSATLYRHLAVAYEGLAVSHATSERSLEHIASLYQALETFSSQEDREKLAELLAEYTAKLCDRPAACLIKGDLDENEQREHNVLRMFNADAGDDTIDWQKHMCELWGRVQPGREIFSCVLPDGKRRIVAVPIVSNSEYFGLVAYVQTPTSERYLEERKKSLTYLAHLGGIILERMKGDKLWGRLLVSEEQNRICNEIHDGVAQYLFSIVCAVHSISKENAYLQETAIQENLRLVEDTAKRASSELRASIYQLSPSKRGESLFVDTLASYLDDLARLNGIKVDLQAEGSEEVLSPALRRGLYRIVREASSNAIRHGKCSALQVNLNMTPARTVLEIEDNGRAFPPKENGQKNAWKAGLGLRNMNQIAAHFDGELVIESKPGQGALVRCTVPKHYRNLDSLKEAISG